MTTALPARCPAPVASLTPRDSAQNLALLMPTDTSDTATRSVLRHRHSFMESSVQALYAEE